MTQASRIVLSHVMEDLPAPSSEIFPLLCPVRESEWVPRWSAEMVWSRSGVAEDGALFFTPGPAGGKEWLWHIVQHDPALGRIRFSVMAPESHVLDLALHLEEKEGMSRLEWVYSLTALTPAGEKFMACYREGFAGKMAQLQRCLHQKLTTGTMLPEGAA